MAPKVARGRRKANMKKVEDDILLKEKNSNGSVEIETVENKSNNVYNCDHENVEGNDVSNNVKKVVGENGNMHTKTASEKKPNPLPKVGPLKRGRKRAAVSPGKINQDVETANGISDNENKEACSDISKDKVIKTDAPIKNLSSVAESNHIAESNSKLVEDKNKSDSKIPLKRGRRGGLVAERSDDELQAEVKVVIEPKQHEAKSLKSDIATELNGVEVGKKSQDDASNEQLQIDETDRIEVDTKKVPLKRGRPKRDIAKTLDEQLLTEETSPNDGKNIPETTRDTLKIEVGTNEAPLKRGRPKKVVTKTLEKIPDQQTGEKIPNNGKNIPEATNDTLKVEINTKEVPLKRGRPKKIITKTSDEQLQTEGKAQTSPGQNKSKSIEKEDERESDEKLSIEHVQAQGKVASRRGRKKANLIESDNLSELNENSGDEKSSRVVKEYNLSSEEQIIPSKRGRKKEDKKETISNLDKKSNIEELIQDRNGKEESEKITKTDATFRIEMQGQEFLPVESKIKDKLSVEEKKDNFNITKVLKVDIQRDYTIDRMIENQTKIIAKAGAKNIKAGSKRTKDDEDNKESGETSAKIPKGESNSKGQSKKDKMPDVTLLEFNNSSTSSSGKPWNLKISSWNVNGVRAWLEKKGLVYISHENPDIMAFQETKCSDKMLPSDVNVKGYHSYWLAGDKDGYSGVGLLSKKEPVSIKYGIGIDEHDKEGRVITAEYEEFYLVTAYVPNASRGLTRLSYRMQWDKDFRAYLKCLDEKKPVILCGDLNVAHEEIDLAKPQSNKKNAGFTKEEREGFSTLLSEGFIDSFRHLYPEEKGAYTFWTYMMNARAKNVGWRLDYFVISKKIAERLCDSVIRKDVFGSDHCPITLFLSV